nr:hypothetical protein CFP56_70236 [Quercus suber]
MPSKRRKNFNSDYAVNSHCIFRRWTIPANRKVYSCCRREEDKFSAKRSIYAASIYPRDPTHANSSRFVSPCSPLPILPRLFSHVKAPPDNDLDERERYDFLMRVLRTLN